MSIVYEKRLLALAGIFQSMHLVSGAAHNGMVAQDSLEKSLSCIFVQNPESFSAIYSGTKDIRLGLSLVSEVLHTFNPQKHAELIKYTLAIMAIERVLVRHPEMLNIIGKRISAIDIQRIAATAENTADEAVITELANLYESTVSHLKPRLKIFGNRNHLQNQRNIGRIRALLLSAIRSAVLWHQVGGRRWQLLLGRGSMKKSLENII
ncbi:MAG: high frequency lysogenization protein HflD [Pseudomonadales bacterium]|nr:high frequency lysogenization protein HflD [Pseudomonadales bacterium]